MADKRQIQTWCPENWRLWGKYQQADPAVAGQAPLGTRPGTPRIPPLTLDATQGEKGKNGEGRHSDGALSGNDRLSVAWPKSAFHHQAEVRSKVLFLTTPSL